MSNNGNNDKSRFTTRDKYEECYNLTFLQSDMGVWLAQFDEPLPIDFPIDQQVEHLLKHAYLSDCNISFVKMYDYNEPKDMIGMSFPQIFDNGEPSNLENLRKFFESNYKISQIETSEIGRNGIRVCFLNDVTGIVENGYLVRVWGMQKDITSSNSQKAILKQLTPEQSKVLKATVEGKTMKEIASDVGVSPKTVESIRTQLKTIFGVDTIARLIAVVIQLEIQSIQ